MPLGNMSPALVEPQRPSLLKLGYDILHNICQILQSSKDGDLPRPLHALSQTCKTLNEISIPIIYHEIKIYSNFGLPWEKATKRVCGLQNIPAIAQYTRYESKTPTPLKI
jgi:hypothetical protein